MTEFEMTEEGYLAARDWLQRTGKYHLLENEQSTDGYTTIALANQLRKKEIQKVDNADYSGKFANPLLTVGEEGILQRVMVLSSIPDDVKSLRELLPFGSVFQEPSQSDHPQILTGTFYGELAHQITARLNAAREYGTAGAILEALIVDPRNLPFSMEVIEKDDVIGGMACRSFFVVVDTISDETIRNGLLSGNYLGARTTIGYVVEDEEVPQLARLHAIDIYPPKEDQWNDLNQTDSTT